MHRGCGGHRYSLIFLLMHRGWVGGGNLVVRPLMFYRVRLIEKLPGGGGHRFSLRFLLMHRGWVRGGNLVVRPQIFDGARPIEKLPGGEGGTDTYLSLC